MIRFLGALVLAAVLQDVDRVDAFLQKGEKDGVTRVDPPMKNVPEEIRLSVVPQLLGYVERFRATKDKKHLEDIRSRADFLVANMEGLLSGGPFDGMSGYALLVASEATGDKGHREAADRIVEKCRKLPNSQTQGNGGLMMVMALAKHAELSGEAASKERAIKILDALKVFQNEDGSFPHWTPGSKDLHYTAWMCVELILIRRSLAHAGLDEMLKRAQAFLEGRIGDDGKPVYEVEGRAGAVYYSKASGCPQDYDTRGWTNELAYYAVIFKDGPAGKRVGKLLASLEKDGAFPDKWAFPHDPKDPVYEFSRAEKSVVRTSLVFWMLALAR